MKEIIKTLLRRSGYYFYTMGSLPKGVDWCLDLREHLKSVQIGTIFDVGANTGQTAREVHHAFSQAQVFSFEPVRSTFLSLNKKAKGAPWLHVHNIALSSQPGIATMRAVPDSFTNSLTIKHSPSNTVEMLDQSMTEEVTLDTVDRFCLHNEVKRIDILKIDTEGHDLEVLKGADAYLTSHKVLSVYIEVTFAPENTQNSLFYPIDAFLKERGFVFRGLYETFFLHKHPQNLTFCNALYLNPTATTLAKSNDRVVQ